MDMDLPDVRSGLEAEFVRYKAALVGNVVPTLEALFDDDTGTVRYGGSGNHYAMNEVRAFRHTRTLMGLDRVLKRVLIARYCRLLGVASMLFRRTSMPAKIGRQSQIWVPFQDGWKMAATHGSLIEDVLQCGPA